MNFDPPAPVTKPLHMQTGHSSEPYASGDERPPPYMAPAATVANDDAAADAFGVPYTTPSIGEPYASGDERPPPYASGARGTPDADGTSGAPFATAAKGEPIGFGE